MHVVIQEQLYWSSEQNNWVLSYNSRDIYPICDSNECKLAE